VYRLEGGGARSCFYVVSLNVHSISSFNSVQFLAQTFHKENDNVNLQRCAGLWSIKDQVQKAILSTWAFGTDWKHLPVNYCQWAFAVYWPKTSHGYMLIGYRRWSILIFHKKFYFVNRYFYVNFQKNIETVFKQIEWFILLNDTRAESWSCFLYMYVPTNFPLL
jgi:hypothetical protein